MRVVGSGEGALCALPAARDLTLSARVRSFLSPACAALAVQMAPLNRFSACVAPTGKKATQKVAVGDTAGCVHVFSMKNQEVSTSFKSVASGGPVGCLTFGLGKAGEQTDKVFYSQDATLMGQTKKGKQFFKFATGLTDRVGRFCVRSMDIYCAANCSLVHFANTKDGWAYNCEDRVDDFEVFMLGSGDAATEVTALACADKQVRLLRRSDLQRMEAGRVENVPVGAPVSCVTTYQAGDKVRDNVGSDAGTAAATSAIDAFLTTTDASRQLLYGTESGVVGQLAVGARSSERGWVLPAASGVPTDMCTKYDLTADGVPDIIVGRDNGTIEVYGFELGAEPTLMLRKSVGESVVPVDAGTIVAPSSMDAMVATFSGKVVAFTPGVGEDHGDEVIANTQEDAKRLSLFRRSSTIGEDDSASMAAAAAASSGRGGLMGGRGHAASVEAANYKSALDSLAKQRAKKLEDEVSKLRYEVQAKEEMYANKGGGEALIGLGAGHFSVKDRLTMNEDATCTLVLETPMPLLAVALKADVPVQLVEVKDNAPIVARTSPPPGSPYHMLATFRMQDARNRFETRLRVAEGTGGTITAHVIPRKPPMSGEVCLYQIKPLCLHRRVTVDPAELADVPMSMLTITGAFSMAVVHAWVAACVPEVPARPPAEDERELVFVHGMVGTHLVVRYSTGRATFASESASTISCVRECITGSATRSGERVDIQFKLEPASVQRSLELLEPRLLEQAELAHRVKLLEALKELTLNEEGTQYLDEDHRATLEAEEALAQHQENAKHVLQFLREIARKLFVDWNILRGVNVKHRLAELDRALEEGSLEGLRAMLLADR